MGNRAVITDTKRTTALYLHWNGGRDSVEAFLEYCRLKRYRSPSTDPAYAFARLAQVVGNYFGGSLSVGVLPYTGDANMMCLGDDNGVYVVGDWEIVERALPAPFFEEQYEYPLDKMLREIDSAQPAREQLGDLLDSREVPTASLTVGSRVWVYEYRGGYYLETVVGIGEGRVNGRDVSGVPYTDAYDGVLGGDPRPSANINNYLFEPTYRIA